MSATCEGCRWWKPAIGLGKCELPNPPSKMPQHWPFTWRSDYCGEHEPREPQESPDA